jgi:hypothetical protein
MLAIDVLSVKIYGDVAKAITSTPATMTELTLVKVDGQWYIAGAKLLKDSF